MGKAGASVAAFAHVKTPTLCMVDCRSTVEKEMARVSLPPVTLHPRTDVYQKKAQLITQVPTNVVWCHNVYNLAKEK